MKVTLPLVITKIFFQLHHSHKKRKDSLETRAVLIKISMICWNLPSGPKRRGSLHKTTTWLSMNGISCLQVVFVLIWMKNKQIKKTLTWFNLQRYGNGNWLSNIKDNFAESLLLQMLVLHLSMYIFKPGLKSSLMAGQNLKKKYLSQIPIKLFKQHAIPNSSLRNLKIYSSKECSKTSQRWIIICM